jgi:hypothetical protein
VAGSRYPINSTKQINPKVLKALKGESGLRKCPEGPLRLEAF